MSNFKHSPERQLCQHKSSEVLEGDSPFCFLDYGQGTSEREQEITDANKKSILFKSRIELSNLFDKNGWDLVDTYLETKNAKAFMGYILEIKSKKMFKN